MRFPCWLAGAFCVCRSCPLFQRVDLINRDGRARRPLFKLAQTPLQLNPFDGCHSFSHFGPVDRLKGRCLARHDDSLIWPQGPSARREASSHGADNAPRNLMESPACMLSARSLARGGTINGHYGRIATSFQTSLTLPRRSRRHIYPRLRKKILHLAVLNTQRRKMVRDVFDILQACAEKPRSGGNIAGLFFAGQIRADEI
jgi:hypothetical protein